MGDQLERFILNNRSAFDDQEPSDEVWRRISQKKEPQKWNGLWKVAAIIFLISTTYLIIDKNWLGSDNQPTEISEFAAVEAFYHREIANKKATLIRNAPDGLTEGFLREIDHLDEMYDELKQTYQRQHPDQKVTDAMINNLKLRMKILDKQLSILEKLKGENNGTDTKENTTIES